MGTSHFFQALPSLHLQKNALSVSRLVLVDGLDRPHREICTHRMLKLHWDASLVATCCSVCAGPVRKVTSMEAVRRGEGSIKRIRNGRLHFAIVNLEIRFPTEEATIIMACHGRGFFSQGSIEEVPARGYDDWK